MSETLSLDAIVFGFSLLSSSRATLSFGGEGAAMAITPRGRAALDELLAAGRAEPAEPDCIVVGREYYRGVDLEPPLGKLAMEAGYNPFDPATPGWTMFSAVEREGGRSPFEPGASWTMSSPVKGDRDE